MANVRIDFTACEGKVVEEWIADMNYAL